MALDGDAMMAAAVCAYREGRLEDAASLGDQLLAAKPEDPEVVLFVGVVAAKQGSLDRAVQMLKDAAKRTPQSYQAHYWLSVARRRFGQRTEALDAARRAVDINPREAQAHHQLGLCLMDSGEWQQAEKHLLQAGKLAPQVAATQFNLGCVLEELGRRADATRAYRRSISLNPKHVQALSRLGHILHGELDCQGALACGCQILALEPHAYAGHSLAAMALVGLNRPAEAMEHATEALQAESGNAGAMTLYGTVLQAIGRMDEAEEYFLRAVELDPLQGYGFFGLVRARRVTTDDGALIKTMERVLNDSALPPKRRRDIEYALGKAYADLGQSEASMRHYDAANVLTRRLQFGGARFDAKHYAANTDFTIRNLDAEFLGKYRAVGSQDPSPIFVVGMMRSGTTLAEQILSCHPKIGAAGEQPFWIDRREEALAPPGNVLNQPGLRRLSEAYLTLLREIAPEKERVVDKMPGNYLHLGLLHVAFPNARLIHMRRHPIDTCLSIWMTLNSAPIEWANDKDDIVFAYREYLRLMDHWRAILPSDRMLEVDYEELVSDQETVSRRMVEFCGLEWDERCLRPQDNTRAVATPSDWQVRQPVHKTAVERWRRFEPWLGAFAELGN